MNNSSPALATITLERHRVRAWDAYPFSIPAIRNLDALSLSRSVCFLTGENGSGKSTLLEAIADHYGLSVEGGSRNMSYLTESPGVVRDLSDVLRLSWRRKPQQGYFLRAESFFNVATLVDELAMDDNGIYGAYGGKSLHEQSHGESFLSLFQHRFASDGFYLLDEPESALSPQRQLSFLVVLHRLTSSNQNVQFLIATHSPIILSFPGAQILSLDGERIEEISYRETQAYRIVSDFLKHPEVYLRHLLE